MCDLNDRLDSRWSECRLFGWSFCWIRILGTWCFEALWLCSRRWRYWWTFEFQVHQVISYLGSCPWLHFLGRLLPFLPCNWSTIFHFYFTSRQPSIAKFPLPSWQVTVQTTSRDYPSSLISSTFALLEKMQYYGLKKENVTIMKQNGVPAIKNIHGEIATKEDGHIQCKPHGHGDIHLLMSQVWERRNWS